MNKIRLNPRGNGPHQSTDSDKQKSPLQETSKSLSEEIQYYLDKKYNEFSKEDIIRFQNLNKQRTDKFLDTSNKIITKLFEISKIYAEDFNEDKDVDKEAVCFQAISNLPDNFSELDSLLTEVVEDNRDGSLSFINTLTNFLINIDKLLASESLSIDDLYGSLSDMLQKLQVYNITQQKYIYRSIANSINHCLTNYTFISPEDGNFVDPKFHKIVSGSGQRITRGLSYILLDSTNDEVLKFGQVKTI